MRGRGFLAMSVAASLAVLGAFGGCGPSKGKLGETCSVYAVTPDCATGLQCACHSSGCFCAPRCSQTGSSTCAQGTCLPGQNPADSSTGDYCFLDGGS